MKYIAALHDRTYYRPIQSSDGGIWLFEDKDTSAFRIKSPTPNPWDQEWLMIVGRQNNKSDRSAYPVRLLLTLKQISREEIASRNDLIRAQIEREQVKGAFAWSDRQPIQFFAFPTSELMWLFYSFYQMYSSR